MKVLFCEGLVKVRILFFHGNFNKFYQKNKEWIDDFKSWNEATVFKVFVMLHLFYSFFAKAKTRCININFSFWVVVIGGCNDND